MTAKQAKYFGKGHAKAGKVLKKVSGASGKMPMVGGKPAFLAKKMNGSMPKNMKTMQKKMHK